MFSRKHKKHKPVKETKRHSKLITGPEHENPLLKTPSVKIETEHANYLRELYYARRSSVIPIENEPGHKKTNRHSTLFSTDTIEHEGENPLVKRRLVKRGGVIPTDDEQYHYEHVPSKLPGGFIPH